MTDKVELKTGRERALAREAEAALARQEYYKDTEFQGNARAERRRQAKAMDKYAAVVARMTRKKG